MRRPLRASLQCEFLEAWGKSINVTGHDLKDRAPLIAPDESPVGYSLAGCPPAPAASASPTGTRMRESGLADRLILSERRKWA